MAVVEDAVVVVIVAWVVDGVVIVALVVDGGCGGMVGVPKIGASCGGWAWSRERRRWE